jgi:NADPH2:quinone reductase
MLANVNLCKDLKLVALQGRILVIGSRGTVADFDPRQCMQKEAAIIGLMTSVTTPDDFQRMGDRIVGLLEGGHITPKIGRVLPIEQISNAHQSILVPGAQGKIVIQIAPNADETVAPEQQ